MTDGEKSADELGAKAAFAVAKHAAGRALDDALLSDEERAKRCAEQDALARRKRAKRVALVALGSLLAVGLIGLMFHYWYWSLLLGLLGAAGLYGRDRLRRYRVARTRQRVEPGVAAQLNVRVEAKTEPIEELDSSIEDDLAALKARMKR